MTLVEGTTDPLWALVTLPFWIVLAKVEGLYDADHPKIWHRTTDEALAIFHWVTLSVAGTLFFIRALPDETVTVEAAAAMYFTALGAAFVFRSAARALWRGLVPPERALVLGAVGSPTRCGANWRSNPVTIWCWARTAARWP